MADDGGPGEGCGGLDEVTRAALEAAEEKVLEDARPALDNVVALAGRASYSAVPAPGSVSMGRAGDNGIVGGGLGKDPGVWGATAEGAMDVLIDWESVPWDEDGLQPGYRGKTFVRDGLEIWRGELTEEFADEGWWTEKNVFVFHVLKGEASVRFKDGRVIPVRQGDSGVIPPGEPGAHTVDVPAGKRCVIVGFAQA